MIYNSHNNKAYFDPFFEVLFGKEPANHGYLPMKTNVYESESAYRLELEIPGVKKENISLDFKEGYLTVAVKVEKEEDGEFKIARRERFLGETSRQFYLGEVEGNTIDATYADGILTIVAKKVIPEEAKPHKIEIH